MYETQLFEPVKNLFESMGYRVMAEVADCDVVAEKDGERIAISEEDGQVYSCYNGQIELWDFEDEIAEILRRCEEKVQEIDKNKTRKKEIIFFMQ